MTALTREAPKSTPLTHMALAKTPVVFVATDLSEHGDEALRHAHERAAEMSARFVVCHVVPNLLGVNMLFPQLNAQQMVARARLEQEVVGALLARVRAVTGRGEGDFELVVREGTPYAHILDESEAAGADLLVLGAGNSNRLATRLLGGVAERVIRYATVPVLVARPRSGSRRVLVATDLSSPTFPALAAASIEAERTGADVTVLYCVDGGAGLTQGSSGADGPAMAGPAGSEQAVANALELLLSAANRFELRGERRVVVGPAAQTIVATAEELKAELVVVGTRAHRGLPRVLLGSVAEEVIRRAPCSVLTVRLEGGADAPTQSVPTPPSP